MPPVTIVSGLPRAGTSLMMQMLAAGGLPVLSDGERAPDDDNPRGYLELEAVKRTRQDPSWVERARGKVVKVVHALLRDLPAGHQYQVVMMHRNLDEVVASQRAMLARLGRPGANLPDVRLGEILGTQLAEVEKWLQRQPNFRVLVVEHRDCLARPAWVAAEVNRFLGGGLDEHRMAGVVDPALHRQRAGGDA